MLRTPDWLRDELAATPITRRQVVPDVTAGAGAGRHLRQCHGGSRRDRPGDRGRVRPGGGAVVVSDLGSRQADGEETVRLVQEAGGKAVFAAADVTRADDQEALASGVIQPVSG